MKTERFAGTISAGGTDYQYQYRTLPVQHLKDLQDDIELLRQQGQISDAETFQEYINPIKFALPENFPEARSILIIAIAIRPLLFHFNFNGRRYPAYMPPNYYQPSFTRAMMIDAIQDRIIGEAGYRVESTASLFLKRLTTRSGLGRYGRNNICYVAGMGSFITLRAYFTDYVFPDDHWQEVRMLDICQECRICRKICPGSAIRDENFVIDIKRCLPLYNEVRGKIPDWFPRDAHHAIFGCMKCQESCPANKEGMEQLELGEELTENETTQIVKGKLSEEVLLSVSRKLRIPYLTGSPETVDVISRNVRALLMI